MALEVGPDGTIKAAITLRGLKFKHRDTGQEFLVVVHDKFPQMGDVHVEGRRYVEVSVEMFTQLVAQTGFVTVDPNEPVAPELGIDEDATTEEDG